MSAPSPLLSKVLHVTCLCVVLGRYQRRSLTIFAFVQAYVAEVICYTPFILQVFAVHLNSIVGAEDVPSLEVTNDRGDATVTCYVTAGTFARRGLSSTAKTLRSLSGVQGAEY